MADTDVASRLPDSLTACRQVMLQLMRRGFRVIDVWVSETKSVIRILPSPRCDELGGEEMHNVIFSNSREIGWVAKIEGVRVEWTRSLTK